MTRFISLQKFNTINGNQKITVTLYGKIDFFLGI